MELDALKFTVETTALDDAITKVGTLQLAVKKLGSDTGSQSARQAAKEQAQITLDQVKAETALIEARGKQARAIESLNSPQEKLTKSVRDSNAVLERQEKIYENMINYGLSKGQASTLAMAQAQDIAAESAQKLVDVMKDTRKYIGGDTFDKSTAGMTAMQNRYETLLIAAKNYADGSVLNIRQAQDLALDTERLAAKNQLLGIAGAEAAASINSMTAAFKALAIQENEQARANDAHAALIKKNSESLAAAERERVQAHLNSGQVLFENNQLRLKQDQQTNKAIMSEMAAYYKAIEAQDLAHSKALLKSGKTQVDTTGNAAVALFVKDQEAKARAVAKSANDQIKSLAKADEMLARLQNRTREMSKEGPVSATAANQLYAYEKALKAAGVGADDATARLAVFRAEQQKVSQLARTEETLRMQHLSRALAPQVTDVTVGLMTGQNPFTVFLQQGGQIRDQIGLSQVAVENLGKVFKDTFIMMGSMVMGMGRALVAFFLTPVGAVVASLAALSLGVYEVTKAMLGAEKQNYEMNKSLIIGNNTMGITIDSMWGIVDAASKVNGISTAKAVEATTALAATGQLTVDEMQKATESAVLFEKYGGGSIKETAEIYKKLSDEPTKAVLTLTKTTSAFTDVIIQQVQEAEAQGDREKASHIARVGYAEWQEESNKRLKASLGDFGSITNDVSNWFTKMWNAVNNYSRPLSVTEKLQEAKKALEEFDKGAGKPQRFIGDTDNQRAKYVSDLAKAQTEKDKGDAEAQRTKLQNEKTQAQAVISELTKKAETTEEAKLRKTTELLTAAKVLGKDASTPEIRDALVDIATGKKGIKEPKTKELKSDSLSFSLANDTAQARKQYDIQLKDQTDFVNQQKQRLDNSLAAKEISQGEYIAREIALVMKGEAEQSKIIEDSMVKEQENYAKDRASLTKQYKDWQAENKGMPDFVDVNKQKAEELQSKLGDLTNTFNSATEKLMASSDKVKETAFTRMIKQISELKGAIREVILEREKFQRSEDELLSKQKRQTTIEDKLRYASPEQAAFIQAQAQEQERLNAVIKAYNEELAKADINLKGYNAALAAESDPVVIKFLQEQITLMEQANEERRKTRDLVSGSIDQKALVQAQNAQLKYQKDQMKALSDSVAGALEEGLYKGGAEGAKSLRNIIEAELRKPITIFIRAIVGSIFGGLSGDTAGGGLAGSGGGTGGLGALYEMYNTYSKGFSNLGTSVTNALNTFSSSALGESMGLSSQVATYGPPTASGVGATISTPTAGASAGATALGTAASYAAGAAAGFSLGKLISGDKGQQTNVNAGVIVGAILGGPIGAAIGGVIGGIANAAFGHGELKMTGSGTRGTFGSTGFQGQQYQNYKREGGWFSSDINTTDLAPVDKQTQKTLDLAFVNLKKSMKDAVESLGLTAEGFKDYSKYVDIASGTTAEGLAAIFTGMADEMVQNLLGTTETIRTAGVETIADTIALLIDPLHKVKDVVTTVWKAGEFVKEGETASTTILRLSNSLITVNTVFDFLGNKLLDVSLKGADAASKLADIFGGLENFTTATKTYYNTYYSEQERAQRSIDDMTKTFAKVNITLPKTKEAFRELVTEASKHLDTEEQRKAYALLISLAPEFAAAVDTLEKVKQSVVDLAKTAASAAMTVLSNAIKAQKEKLALEYNTQLDKYNEQLTSVTDNLSKLTSLANQLKSTLDGMRISGSEAEYRTAAQAQIQQALNTARSGGGLPLNGELTSALATVSKPSEQLFGSFEDYARDFYRTANNISDLSDITGAALTADQLTQNLIKEQIRVLKEKFDADNKVLDDILTEAQEQIDIANGINTNILSVVDALKLVDESIKALNKANAEKEQAAKLDSIAKFIKSVYDTSSAAAEKSSLQKISDEAKNYGVSLADVAQSMGFSLESVIALFKKFGVDWQTAIGIDTWTKPKAPGISQVGTPTTGGGSAGVGTSTPSTAKYKQVYQLPNGSISYDVVDPAAIARYDSIASAIGSIGTGSPEAVANLAAQAQKYGVSMFDLATASGYNLSDVQKLFNQVGIPSFDIGTNFVPNDMLANIHKGERIIPAADNSMLMQMVSQGSNNELKEELKDMKIQLKTALDKISDNTKQTRDILDNVTAGGSAMLTEVA